MTMVWMLNKHACGAVEVLGINSKQVENQVVGDSTELMNTVIVEKALPAW